MLERVVRKSTTERRTWTQFDLWNGPRVSKNVHVAGSAATSREDSRNLRNPSKPADKITDFAGGCDFTSSSDCFTVTEALFHLLDLSRCSTNACTMSRRVSR